MNKGGKFPLFIRDNKLWSICSSTSVGNRMFLYSEYNLPDVSEPVERFNINLETLKRGLDCIKTTEPFVEFSLNNGVLSYKDSNIRFNIRCLQDSIVAVPKVNVIELEKWPIDYMFTISEEQIGNIIKAITFLGKNKDSKIYVESEDGKISLFFGDRESKSSDGITIPICDVGSQFTPRIFDISIFDPFDTKSGDITFKIYTNGTASMETKEDNNKQVYITTSLKK